MFIFLFLGFDIFYAVIGAGIKFIMATCIFLIKQHFQQQNCNIQGSLKTVSLMIKKQNIKIFVFYITKILTLILKCSCCKTFFLVISDRSLLNTDQTFEVFLIFTLNFPFGFPISAEVLEIGKIPCDHLVDFIQYFFIIDLC